MDCLKLGDWYRGDLADKASKEDRPRLLGRAGQYYNRFLELHDKKDTMTMKVRLGLKTVRDELRQTRGVDLPEGAVLMLNFERDTVMRKSGARMFRDLSGHDNHAIYQGVVFVPGIAGDAGGFDGKAAMTVRNSKSLQITGNMTICMWLYPKILVERRNPFDKCYGAEGTMTIELNGSINYFYGTSGIYEQPYTSSNSSSIVVANKWMHIVLVRDVEKKIIRWYKDGKQVNERTCAYKATAASKYDIRIGHGYCENFIGMIDELAIFNRALPAKDVEYLFNLGKGKQPLPDLTR
jgi:hypothetical protein